uniref:Uncharacterized protein n=1 Tax=Vitis vinifera TaxID=29760 RepID=F6HVV7_VITVI
MAVSEKTMNQRCEIPIKRLTESELRACREKGLCFKCDEKFSPAWLKGLLNIAQTWTTCGKVRARGINHNDVQVSKFEDKAKQTQRWKRDGKYEAVA